MKKRGLCLLICLCLCLNFGTTALALTSAADGLRDALVTTPGTEDTLQLLETPESSEETEADTLPYVTDAAGILTEWERESLNAMAAEISEQYGLGVYVVVLENYKNYTGGSVGTCAEELYRYYDLGLGDGRDGMLLLMSMAERDYDLWGYGPFARYAFTDYGMDQVEESFLPYFRQNNWYGGFQAYIRGVARLLEAAAQGEPVDYRIPVGAKAAAAVAPASLIGFLVCGIFKRQMKTAKEKETAEDYVVSGSVRLRIREDRFINRTRSVQVIESSGGRGGGGGGGTSHHSGKF